MTTWIESPPNFEKARSRLFRTEETVITEVWSTEVGLGKYFAPTATGGFPSRGFAPLSRLSSSSRFLTRDYAASDPRSGPLVAAGIRTAAHVHNKLRSQNILVPELYHCSPRINCTLSVPYIIADNTCPNFSFPTRVCRKLTNYAPSLRSMLEERK